MTRRQMLLAAASITPMLAGAAGGPFEVDLKTLPFARRGGIDLMVDLYLPRGTADKVPTVLFLHGGGWTGGTRTTGPDFRRFFAREGFAMASIEYRLTPGVRFPSNVEDVKTAIRWLRANATEHRLNGKVGIWGTSAGGHLAAMAALTPRGVFEGDGSLEQPATVDCVLNAYGPSSFLVMDAQTEAEKSGLQALPASLVTPGRGGGPGSVKHDAPNSAESNLVGAPIQSVPELVRAASPLTYVKAGAPPFLLMHGLADNSVPHHQSVMLYEALAAAGNDVTLRLIDGLPHTFFNRPNLDETAGPFRMDVRVHPRGGTESKREERAGVFDVARDFFAKHLA